VENTKRSEMAGSGTKRAAPGRGWRAAPPGRRGGARPVRGGALGGEPPPGRRGALGGGPPPASSFGKEREIAGERWKRRVNGDRQVLFFDRRQADLIG